MTLDHTNDSIESKRPWKPWTKLRPIRSESSVGFWFLELAISFQQSQVSHLATDVIIISSLWSGSFCWVRIHLSQCTPRPISKIDFTFTLGKLLLKFPYNLNHGDSGNIYRVFKFWNCFANAGLVLSTSASIVKREAGSTLFTSGREYVYKMSLSATAGSTDYVSFGSVFNITGDIHIQSTGNTLNVKITDLLLGTYNGELDMRSPAAYAFKPNAKLDPLTEPFQVQVESGKVTRTSLYNHSWSLMPYHYQYLGKTLNSK